MKNIALPDSGRGVCSRLSLVPTHTLMVVSRDASKPTHCYS